MPDPAAPSDAPPRVFLSYSHDSEERRARVLTLANRLRADGIDARLDRYVRGTPPEGWPTWMTNEIHDADFVLVVCTAIYEQRALKREPPGKGLGATWEAGIVTQVVYDAQGRNTRFIPVVLDGADVAHIPVFLRGATRYDVSTDAGYGALLDYLTGHHDAPMPPLGRSRRPPGGVPSNTADGLSTNLQTATTVAPARPEPAPPPREHAEAPIAATNPQTTTGNAFAGREAVVLHFDDGEVIAYGADRIEATNTLILELVATSPAGAARLHALRDRVGPTVYGSPPLVAIAYGTLPTTTTIWAHVRSVGHEISAGTTRWRLTLEPQAATTGLMDDVSINGYSPDDIAGWRARRILLDERPADRRPGDPIPGKFAGGLRLDPMVDSMVSGAVAGYGRNDGRSLGSVTGSPLPALFAAWDADRAAFLTAARLTATLWLVLTRTVERVRRLDLAFASQDRLTVDFEGVRRRVATNREPVVVVVDGECPLRR